MMDFEYEKMSLGKILSRRSSLGCSSRNSYYRSGEGVPFKWEMQPGVAKERPKDDLPPLSPPPALLSLGLPKPCVPDSKSSSPSRLRFWKKRVKQGMSKMSSQDCFHEEDVTGLDMFARFDCSSDSESVASSRGSSFSSWSSMSFVKSPTTTTMKEVDGKPLIFGCFPMHVSRVFVSVARRD